MQLMAIGEGLKKVDNVTGKKLLTRYPQIEWKKLRECGISLSHHYFDVHAEAIFDVCRNHVPRLADTLAVIIKDIS